ncbi:hypothetical protein KUTeg_002151 [Tegillarca granosa]|uniref:SET domain-containing protein n=1 Tax=Tegillarca granosa TaxID=220873 RepID=A0ABQ9FTI7_TEGGR|nr:hypothetical protein KUTeg_002151 [Tegillarca granosa]
MGLTFPNISSGHIVLLKNYARRCLEIKARNMEGRGIITLTKRHKGEFLMEYAEKLISADEGEKRDIDATEESGQFGRLINHGDKKERNSIMKIIENCLCLLATRDIEVGEEIVDLGSNQELEWLANHMGHSLSVHQIPDVIPETGCDENSEIPDAIPVTGCDGNSEITVAVAETDWDEIDEEISEIGKSSKPPPKVCKVDNDPSIVSTS